MDEINKSLLYNDEKRKSINKSVAIKQLHTNDTSFNDGIYKFCH